MNNKNIFSIMFENVITSLMNRPAINYVAKVAIPSILPNIKWQRSFLFPVITFLILYIHKCQFFYTLKKNPAQVFLLFFYNS